MACEHQARDSTGPELGQACGERAQESASCGSENLGLDLKRPVLTDSQPLLTLQGELVEK